MGLNFEKNSDEKLTKIVCTMTQTKKPYPPLKVKWLLPNEAV